MFSSFSYVYDFVVFLRVASVVYADVSNFLLTRISMIFLFLFLLKCLLI